MTDNVKIVIEGEYIDSFVYSGVLFIVNSDLVLKAYSWDKLFSQSISHVNIFRQVQLKNYAKGFGFSIPKDLRETYSLSADKLKGFELCSKELSVWPSDINIYKNRFYVASECGVDALDFDWKNGAISSFSKSAKIFDEVSFKLATNSHYRLAIAAGNSGLLSVIPDKKFVNRSHVNQLVDAPCSDCQWQNDNLIANTQEGQYIASFLPIPKKVDFEGTDIEYWNKVRAIKKAPPKIGAKKEINGEAIVSSWFSGENIFNVTDKMNLYLSGSKRIDDFEIVDTNSELSTLKYFKAQSSPFGTIMEIGDQLKLFTDNKEHQIIAEEVVNWRLFPKSTSYLNHLHIIEDDYLSVSLFDTPQISNINKFGYRRKPDDIGD
ncbi:hypothetical protein [Photobacterium sanguinicancri]|uniref:Uncharacterized protein n=1 Tax=Photobacterium sanguinicancri TaxID=875932 RepID=A0AAW7YB81_9GAMM|nr:hypothetical protein [Photobacterium sanguinicancri]MDO6545491.1 hypothetical protein [Photobacterium sanguinicancri]